MNNDTDTTKALLKAIDRAAFWISIVLAILLTTLYLFLDNSEVLAFGNEKMFRDFILAISPEFIAILIAFAFSYSILRKVQEIKAEFELKRVAELLANQVSGGQGNIEGISIFRTDRAKLPHYSQLLQSATDGIDLLAVQHGHLVRQHLGLLEQKAETGCKIRILMLNPYIDDGTVNPNVAPYESRWRFYGLQSRLEDNYNAFRDWLTTLSGTGRGNVEVRVYNEQPIGNYVLINKDLDSGFVQVEFFVFHGIHIQDIPHYVVYRSKDPAFFIKHVNSFNSLWDKANILPL